MYAPRIYIRDYGEPTRRMLAYFGEYDLTGNDIATRRALFLRAESGVTGVDAIIFSGDAAPGALLLSGDAQTNGDRLVTTNSAGSRVRGGEITIRLGDIL